MRKNNRNIAEAINRKEYGMIENELMKLIRRNYNAIMSGEKTLLDMCKMVTTNRPFDRNEKMEIYKIAKRCVSLVEDDMAAETNFGERRPFSFESKNRSVKLTESQIKAIIKESVKRALTEAKSEQWYDDEDELNDRKRRRSWAGNNKFHDNNEKRIKDLETKKNCKGDECDDYEAPLKRKYFYNEPNGRPKTNSKVRKFKK